jgi:hypothetical protein
MEALEELREDDLNVFRNFNFLMDQQDPYPDQFHYQIHPLNNELLAATFETGRRIDSSSSPVIDTNHQLEEDARFEELATNFYLNEFREEYTHTSPSDQLPSPPPPPPDSPSKHRLKWTTEMVIVLQLSV